MTAEDLTNRQGLMLVLVGEGSTEAKGNFEDLWTLWYQGLVACNQHDKKRTVWLTPRGKEVAKQWLNL